MTGRIVSLNRSSGGVPKLPVDAALVTERGMEGDQQRDLRHHGGPDRALSLYSLDLIEQLQLEGHPIAPGTTGENVTIRGIDWRVVRPGCRLSLGPVEIEVTGFATPCKNIRESFLGDEIARISEKLHPGWSRVYARVTAAGILRRGEDVALFPV
jgi:MOSC domain-containing protein YiiM